MKKKNGFIATSLIYTFLIVFVSLTAIIIATYSHYRTLMSAMNNDIITALNERISSKYVLLTNLIKNGSAEEDNPIWTTVNVSYVNSITDASGSSYTGLRSFKFENVDDLTYIIQNNIPIKAGNNRTYYARFRVFRSGELPLSSSVYHNSYTFFYKDGTEITQSGSSESLIGSFTNWSVTSYIIKNVDINELGHARFVIYFSGASGMPAHLFVDDIMLIDITEILEKTGWTAEEAKAKLDGPSPDSPDSAKELKYRLDYFNDVYSYAIH